eukprot:Plantae.Rhodophyta-Hildenbrandia_rubra.ctg101.p1 GENE.Plantae.Rhodophyta-Hildenbrandia_rubra.ctg101~~Plantae.Rhodophyta-Hildenbrandia_rubra.ctg101.p1  ORF type:complete len:417 (+),score=87.73 Plantae.Rhodophyta-Hildenbrandia_rubra.ctg101:2998-4248(+)
MGSVATHHPPFADRVTRLGTETAYAVALEAANLRKKGRTVYSFHIGDLNFSTPQCVVDACKKALDEGKTGYVPAAGIPELRKAMADHYNEVFGLKYTPENVSVQSGGKPGIGKFLMCLCNEGDEVLYPTPGYPIYESMIRFLGCKAVPYVYEEVDGKSAFMLDVGKLEGLITNKTKAIFVNNFQNPMGVAHSKKEMEDMAQLCVKHDLFCFSDDPYYKITFADFNQDDFVHIATLPGMEMRTLCGYTFSKSFSMTGWRLGAVLGPRWLVDMITKINTNDEACTTNFVQHAGVTALTDPDAAKFTKDMVVELEKRRDVLAAELEKVPGFKPIKPKATFYMCVNVTEAMKALGCGTDLEMFRKKVLEGTGVSFCTRAHFGTPRKGETKMYVRFAFSATPVDTCTKAAQILKEFMEGYM